MNCERCGANEAVAETYSVDDGKEMWLCVFCRTVEFYCAVCPFEPKEEHSGCYVSTM